MLYQLYVLTLILLYLDWFVRCIYSYCVVFNIICIYYLMCCVFVAVFLPSITYLCAKFVCFTSLFSFSMLKWLLSGKSQNITNYNQLTIFIDHEFWFRGNNWYMKYKYQKLKKKKYQNTPPIDTASLNLHFAIYVRQQPLGI